MHSIASHCSSLLSVSQAQQHTNRSERGRRRRADHEDGGLIEQVGQVCTSHANGELGYTVQQSVSLPYSIAASRNGLVLCMDLQDTALLDPATAFCYASSGKSSGKSSDMLKHSTLLCKPVICLCIRVLVVQRMGQ